MENGKNVPNRPQQSIPPNQRTMNNTQRPQGTPNQQGGQKVQQFPNQQQQQYPNQQQQYPNQQQNPNQQQQYQQQQGQGYTKPKSTKKGWILGTMIGMIVTGGVFAGLVYGKVFTIDERGLYNNTVELQATIDQMAIDYDQLRNDKANMTITESSKSTSLQYVEGTDSMQLVTVDNKLIFPTKLNLKYTKLDASLSKLQVGSFYQMIPTSSWNLKNQGNTVLLNHSSGIQGSIQSLSVDADQYNETDNFLGKHSLEQHKENIIKFFTDFPKAELEFRKIYFGTIEVGYLAKAQLDIDGKPSELLVFSMTQGYNGLQGIFKYDQGVLTGYESVEVLLETVRQGEDSLVVE